MVQVQCPETVQRSMATTISQQIYGKYIQNNHQVSGLIFDHPKAPVFLSAAEAILWESLGFSSTIDFGMYTFDSLWTHGSRMSTALQLEFCSASNNSSCGYYAFIFQARFSMAFLHLHWGYPSYDEQSGCICLILAVPRQKFRLHR